jgi:hypothetical protein
MRTKLFHTIVLCGAALGGAVGCSGGEDDSEQQETGTGGDHATGGTHNCAPGDVATGGTGTTGGSGGAPGGGAAAGCGGWPPTK